MRKVQHVETAVWERRVVQLLQKRRSELELRVTCIAHNCSHFARSRKELLIVDSFQQLATQDLEGCLAAGLPSLVQLQKKARIDVTLGQSQRLTTEHILSVIFHWHSLLCIGQHLHYNLSASHKIRVECIIMLRQSGHFLTHSLVLHRAAARQPSREETLLSRQQQQIAVGLYSLLREDGRSGGGGFEGEWIVGD